MPRRSTEESRCGDVTGDCTSNACDFKTMGNSGADVLQRLMANAKNDHGLPVTAGLARTARANRPVIA